eukprot:33229_1
MNEMLHKSKDYHGTIHASDLYKVFDGVDDPFLSDAYKVLDVDCITYWYDMVLNPFIKWMSETISTMKHWSGLEATWAGMKELLLYKINASRHVDSPHLFYPNVEFPSDGLVVICHNFVNGTIRGSKFEHGKPKTFCISTNQNVKWSCKDSAIALGMHYDGIKAGDVVILAKG